MNYLKITTYYFLFSFCFFIFFANCNNSNSSSKHFKTEKEIVDIIDAVPLNQPDLYMKTIKDSAKNDRDVQNMCVYVLTSGWRQKPDVYTSLLKKIDETYGNTNDTINYYVQNYTAQNFLRLRQTDTALIILKKTLATAEKIKDSLFISNTHQSLGMAYLMAGRIMQSLTNMQQAMNYLPAKNLANLADLKADLTNVYAKLRDFKKAKTSMFESFQLAKKYKDSASVALYATHLSNAYLDLSLGDSTLWAAQQAQKCAVKMQDSALLGLSYYYMGAAYDLKGDYSKAIEYGTKAVAISEVSQDIWLNTRAKTIIANGYLRMGELERSKSLYQEIWRDQNDKMGIKINTRVCDSMVVLELQKAGNKELRNYFIYVRSFMDSTFSAQEMSIWEDMNVRYETEKKENEIKKLATAKKEAQLQTLIAVLILLLVLGIGSWVIYRNRQQKLLLEKEKTILEASKQLLEINKQLQNKEIEEHKRQLELFKENILAKNTLIEEMQVQVSGLLNSVSLAEKDNIDKNKLALNAMKILTDADWRTYLEYFEKAKPGFIERINKTFPKLTQGELRLFLLMNLCFIRSEIADILGISSEGVRKNQYRLRKKLEIEDDASLEDFIKYF